MSIPKEKTILLKIKEIVKDKESLHQDHIEALNKIEALVDSYVDPGYIGGPIVGEAEGEEK